MKSEKFVNKIKDYLLGMLVGVTIGAVVLVLCKNFYASWESAYYLTCPLLLFFAPGLILFYYEKKHGYLYLITGLLSLVLQIKFTLGITGAWWLYVLVVLLVFVRRIFSIKRQALGTKRLLLWIGAIIVAIVLVTGGTNIITNGQVLYKLQSLAVIFTKNNSIYDWYATLGASIQTRVDEIVNIMIELFKKPWFLLFGKGYGGTVLKYWGISNWNISGSTFADVQIAYGTYSSFHMGFAEAMINFGLLGIILSIRMIKDLFVQSVKHNGNTWIILGTLWFLIFYACYYSFLAGLAWICYGLYLRTKKQMEGIVDAAES